VRDNIDNPMAAPVNEAEPVKRNGSVTWVASGVYFFEDCADLDEVQENLDGIFAGVGFGDADVVLSEPEWDQDPFEPDGGHDD